MSRTQGGIFTTPGDAYTTPVDMWVKALGVSSFHFQLVQRNQFSIPAFTLVLFWHVDLTKLPVPDLLLEKLHRNHDLARIRAIGGSAQVSTPSPSPTLSNPLTHLPTARTRLVEGKRGSQPSCTRPSPQPQQSAHITMFLDTQCSGRSGHIGAHSCACHRSSPRWPRSHGSSCRNLCSVIPYSRTTTACA